MAPTYERVLGVEKSELDDERFLGRLRRSGIGETEDSLAGGEGEGKRSRYGC
jgi:hypothetical protein